MLKFVASGPFGDEARYGHGWAAVGLLVHYGIMACMVAAYMTVAQRGPALLRHAVLAGLAYGLLLWLVMYWAVMPLRWPDAPLPHTPYEIANALFSPLRARGPANRVDRGSNFRKVRDDV